MNYNKKHYGLLGFITVQLFLWASPVFAAEDNSIILMIPPILSAQKHQSHWWKPSPGTTWQWQLDGTIDTSLAVDMYDIDYEAPISTIQALHAQGKIVICYMSAGTFEEYRPDADQYPESIKGNTLPDWPGEKWVDIHQLDILGPILEARMDLAASKGCDGIEPDNVDAYQNNPGFPLTYNDQIVFNTWLAQQAHQRNLSVGLKNDLDQVVDLEPLFDWALNEQCFQYEECDLLLPFINNGKAVFGVEYEEEFDEDFNPDVFCPEANENNFDWLIKNYDLDASRDSCR